MLIGVVGGTGTAGRSVVREALSRGLQVRVLTRSQSPQGLPDDAESRRADVANGEGLQSALSGVGVVIDCGNSMEVMSKRKLSAYFEQGTRNLAAAEAAAGVSRHVVLSIVGIDDVPTPYYKAKLAQEHLAAAGSVAAVVVRSTQFHDFAGQIMSQTRMGPFAFVPNIAIQPVAAGEVARVLLDVAQDPSAAHTDRWTKSDVTRRRCATHRSGGRARTKGDPNAGTWQSRSSGSEWCANAAQRSDRWTRL